MSLGGVDDGGDETEGDMHDSDNAKASGQKAAKRRVMIESDDESLDLD